MGEIMVNRMYVGDYLTNGLGHEVINLFKSDNGKNYIYALSAGDFQIEHSDKVEAVLLVRGIDSNRVEILAKAEKLKQIVRFPSEYKVIPGLEMLKNQMVEDNEISKIRREIHLEQKKFIDENNVTYGGVKLYDIFQNNSTATLNSSIFITFEAEVFRKVKQPIYLVNSEIKTTNDYRIHRGRLSGSALATFYNEDKNAEDFNTLQEILSNDDLWCDEETTTIEELLINNECDNNSFIQIIKKEYDELAYSNMLAYFLETNPDVFYKFAKDILKISNLQGSYSIYREKANIDLLINDDKNVIVIENKIKSGLNGIKYDSVGDIIGTQLEKYYDYVCNEEEFNNKEKKFFIFVPDYNKLITTEILNNEKAEKYKVIYYSELFEFFEKQKAMYNNDKYFYEEFLKALKIHTNLVDNNHYEEMLQRLKVMINSLKAK